MSFSSSKETPWIGVDFDRTLAYYESWDKQGRTLGEPITETLIFVKALLSQGKRVKIFTARVASTAPDREENLALIRAWLVKYLGQELEITAEKDYACEAIYDDIANPYRVVANKGIIWRTPVDGWMSL